MTAPRWSPVVQIAGGLVMGTAWLILLVPLVGVGRRAVELWPLWKEYRESAVASRGDAHAALLAAHPRLGWRPVPGVQWPIDPVPGEHEGGTLTIDGSGRRVGPPVSVGHPPATRRIVTLGDSFTFCTGPWEDGWPALLQERLEGVDVVNLGVPEYDIGQVLLRWNEEGPELDADVAIVAIIRAMFVRSTAPRAYSGLARPMYTLRDGALVPPEGPLPAPIPSGRTLDGPFGFVRFVATGVVQGEWHAQQVDPALPSAILEAMVASLRASGVRPILAYLPIRHELQHDVGDAVLDVGARTGTPVVDLRAALAEHGDPMPPEAVWFLPDYHYNRAGNELLAEALAPVVAAALDPGAADTPP